MNTSEQLALPTGFRFPIPSGPLATFNSFIAKGTRKGGKTQMSEVLIEHLFAERLAGVYEQSSVPCTTTLC